MSGHGHKPTGAPTDPNLKYEPTDAKATPLVVFTVGLAVFTVACFIAGWVVYYLLEKGRSAIDPSLHPMAVERKLVDGAPRLQIAEASDLAAYRKAAEAKANGYGWISREASVVRVPVAKAMDLVLKNDELKSRE